MFAVLVQPSGDTDSKRERTTILLPGFHDIGVGISVIFTTCKFSLGSAPASLAMKEYEKWKWETKRTLNMSLCPYPNSALSNVASVHLPPAQGTAPSQSAAGITPPKSLPGDQRSRAKVSSPLAAICFERQSTPEPGQSPLQAKPGVFGL